MPTSPTPPDAATLARLAALRAKMTTGEWSVADCSHGGRIVRRGEAIGRNAHPQSHLQIMPAEDGDGIVALVNAADALIAGCQALDAVYRQIAKLPNPIHTASDLAGFCRCQWCGEDIEGFADELPDHPDTDCLWPRALAALDLPADAARKG